MPEALADAAETRYTPGPDGELFAYRRFGRAGGVPLVMCMRLRGTLDHWDPLLLDLLAADREIIIFDYRGVNGSTGQPATTIEDMVDGSLAFVRALGLERFDVLGWSMGGIVAQGIALTAPDLVRRLVVAASSTGGLPDLPPMSGRTREIMGKPSYDEEDYLHLFHPDTDQAREAGRDSLRRMAVRLEQSQAVVSPEATRAQFEAIASFQGFWHRRSELTMPTLVAGGAHDTVIHSYALHAMSRELPHAKVVIYSDAGHGFLAQHAEDFAAEVARFLK
ncbi:alpha/beta fold hydrolase [Streptomyces seoulensis]